MVFVIVVTAVIKNVLHADKSDSARTRRNERIFASEYTNLSLILF